ncbi:unnamed protein product [Cylindrotheca closterium]|uniref:Uncharacterized protein n=1 Tax=Cylindrotheca closterium TaxID=2856 RepID=A0AAD2G8Q6_9STRA|nr:unnamed protein product [Cylindrotheca closterium]
MTRTPIRYLSLLIAIVSHSANGECVICPNGLEFPDAQIPQGDDGGTVSCTEGASIMSSYDRNSCVATQVGVIPICCPSQFQLIAKDNVCGWCKNNGGTTIETLDASFRGPLDGMGDATCADILPGIALATDTTGCSVYEYAEQYCCHNAQPGAVLDEEGTDTRGDVPANDGGGGDTVTAPPPSNCHFCNSGIEFPNARPMKGDETDCQEVANIFIQIRSALLNNEMACNSYRQLEFTCCPSSIDIPNPVGNGDEHGLADDIVPKAATDQTPPVVEVVQNGDVTIDTEVDEAVLAGVGDGNSTTTAGAREGDAGGAAPIGVIPDIAVVADLIFNNHGGSGGGGSTTNKDKNTADTTTTGTSSTSSTNKEGDGIDYDIIYPDENSGSLRHTTFGSVSMMSCGVIMTIWLLQSR